MTTQQFVNALAAIAPDTRRLKEEGFEGIHLELIQKNYLLQKKTSSQSRDHEENSLTTLLKEYQAQYIRFDDYAFYEEIIAVNDLTVFAESSGSILGYTTTHGEIVEYDRDELSLLYSCAKDSEHFLEAIYHLLELISKRLQGLVNRDDAEVNEQYVKKCTESAGGQKYTRFFRMLIL